ncbi:hypothetical protein BJ742DRAFT_42856 [Cladochytrium replicatum]|nr:hypothetical protein BJ742DRAFT_42856 [Cladochytrium replicatum]
MEWLRKTVRFEGRPDLSGGGRRFSTDSTASGLEGARRAGSRSLGLLQDSSGAAHCCQLSRSGTGSFGNDADGEQLAMLFEDFRSQWATYVDDGADERKAIVSRENDPGRSSYESSNEATAEYPTVSKTPSQLRREEHEGIAFGAFEIYVKAFNLRFQEAETLSVAERNQILSIFLETPAFPIPIRRIVESPSPPPLRPARSFGFFLAAASASPPPSSATSATESSLGSAQVNRASSIGDHPHDPVVLVCTVLKVLVGKLRTVRLKRQGDESLDEVQLHYQLFLVVKHFEILSRYPGNKECFARHGGLETICSLLEEAVSMMLDLLSGSDGSGVTDREHVVENHVLNIIVWGLKVTQRCLDPEDRWQMYIKTGGEQMNEPGDSTDGSQLPVDSPTIVSLVGTIVKLISFTGTQSHRYAVRSQALNALSAAVIYSPRLARRHFLALDGVEKLCSHIGWPRFLLQNANETVEASNNQGLLQNPQLEFFCQLLALNVAQFLTRISLTCAKQLEDHGVWSRMAEVVQWTSYKRGTWLIGSDSTLQKQESLGALSHEFFRSPRAEEDEHFSKEEGDVGGRRWDCPQTFNEAEYLSLKLDKGTDDSSIGPPVLPGIIGRMSTEHLLLRSFLWSVCLQSGDPLVPENSVDQTPLSPPLLDPAREEYINQGEQPEDKSQSIGGNSERPTFIYLQRVVQMLTSMFSSDDGEDSVSTNANTKADDLMPHKQLFQRKLLGQEPSVHFPPVLQLFVASVIGDLLSDEDAVETVDGSAVNDGDVDDDAIDLDRDRRVKTLQTMEENATFELLVSRHFGFVARMSDNPYEHPLRQYVLQMLIVVGCQPRPGLLPNVTACRVLLHLLVNWPKVAENDDLLNGPIWALIELLCLRPEATKKSLLRLQCLDQLVPLLIDEQKVKGSQGSVGSRGTSDVVRTHVWSLMGLFDNLLERNSEMLIYLFADRQSLNVFFKLLPHPRATVSDFVCRHIMSILGVLPIKFPTLRKWPSTDLTASPMGSPIGRSPRSLSQIDSGSQPSQDTTTEELLLLYTEFFPQTIADKASFELQKRLLRGLRSLLKGYTGSAKERRTVQMALVDARAFEHLLGVLSVRIVPFGELSSPTVRADEWAGGRQIFAQLCEEVLLTITAVMADNRRAKAAFRDLQGYETIRIRVFVNGNWPPWRGFLNRMVGMLYDYVDTGYDFIAEGEIDDLNEPRFEENILAKAYLVRNPDVLDALISVYPHLDTPSQDAALDQLIFAAKTHDMNRVVFNQISFLPKLMNAVLPIVTSKQQVEKTMDLIETIALFSVSTADAKLILSRLSPRPASLMGNAGEESSASEVSLGTLVRKKIGIYERFGSQEKSELLLPFYYDQLCDSILTMIKKKEQNMDFFYFTGRRSGLALPKITRWPISTGYTFATWFKLDPVLGEGVLLEGLSNPRKRKGSTQSEHGQNPNQNEGARPFSQAGASNDSAARLFSMLTAQGNGAELFIMNDLLHYVVIRNGVTSTVAVSNFRLLQNKWYFVAVSHVGPLPWSAQSEVSIYLNGNIRLKAKMDFPAADVYNQCRIGARALDTQSTGSQQADSTASTNADGPVLKSRRPGEAKAGQSNVYKDHFFNCFAGQTTSVYFFDDSLGLAQLNGIYKLGMGYSLQFRTKDGAQTTDTIESSGSLGAVFDGTLYSKLHMHFHPSATKNNRTCFDVSPKAVNNKLEGYMMNTLSCATKCFRTSIHALGGIEILYPLAIHLDIPNATPPYISPESVDDSTRDLSVSRATLFLQLVASLLEDSIHQLHFAQLRGAKIAAMLLNYANPRFLKMITLDAIMTFAKALTDTDQRLEAYEALIFDMRLWAAAPFAVQKEYFEFLRHFIAGHFDTFRSKFGVSFYLDTLDLFYWYDPPVPNPGTKMVPNLSPSDIQRLVLTRPTKHQLRKLRQHIFGIIKEYIRDGIQSYEAEALIRVLWTQNNSLHVSEILELLTELIRDGPPNAEKLGGSDSTGEEDITLPNSQPTALADEILHSGGGLDMFAELLNHVEEDTRLRAILLMSTIVHDCGSVSEKWKKKLKFEEITLPTVSPSMNTLGSVPAISSSPSQHFGSGPVGSSGQTGGAAGVSTLMLFTSQLERFPLTELTYLALLEYAMGEKLLSSSLGIEGERSVKVLRRPHETPLTATFEAPAVFQIILELACRPQNADLRLRVVQDLLMLVDRSSTNCDRFRRGVPNWQTILLIHMIPVGAFKHLINLDTEPEPQIIYPGRAEDRTDENRVDDWNPYILDTNETKTRPNLLDQP